MGAHHEAPRPPPHRFLPSTLSVLLAVSLLASVSLVAALSPPPVLGAEGDAVYGRMLDEINPGPADGIRPDSYLVEMGGYLYFPANSPDHGPSLWRTDGVAMELVVDTLPGPQTTSNLDLGTYPRLLAEMDRWLYFVGADEQHGAELWRTNGTGGERVTDINPDKFSSNPGLSPGPGSFLQPANIGIVNGSMYFNATRIWPDKRLTSEPRTELDGWYEYELYSVTDGAVTDHDLNRRELNGNPLGSRPQSFHVYDGHVYFWANDTEHHDFHHSNQLWRITPTGAEKLYDPNEPEGLLYPDIEFGGFAHNSDGLYLSASLYDANGNKQPGLWRTVQGRAPELVHEVDPGCKITGVYAFDNEVYFVDGAELWRASQAGTTKVATFNDEPTNCADSRQVAAISSWVDAGEAAYFVAEDPVHGVQLWRTDGTELDLIEVNPSGDSFGTDPVSLEFFEGYLYFSGNDGTGYHLLRTDGTTVENVWQAGTQGQAAPIQTAPQAAITTFADNLYFVARDDETGNELWSLVTDREVEGPYGSPTCEDEIDNDDNNLIDDEDPGCWPADTPDGFEAVAGDGEVTLSWSIPEQQAGDQSDIVEFYINTYPGDIQQVIPAQEHTEYSTTVTGLSNATAYTFELYAVNGYGSRSHLETEDVPRAVATPTAPTQSEDEGEDPEDGGEDPEDRSEDPEDGGEEPEDEGEKDQEAPQKPDHKKPATKKSPKPAKKHKPKQVKRVKLKQKKANVRKKNKRLIIKWKKVLKAPASPKVKQYRIKLKPTQKRLRPKQRKPRVRTVKAKKNKIVWKKLTKGTYIVRVRAVNKVGAGKWSKKMRIRLR